MKTWKKVLIGVGAALVLCIIVAVTVYQSRKNLVTVQTGKVQKQNLASVVSASGEIKPKTYVNIGANAFGKIVQLHDLAKRIGADVHIRLRLDLTRCAHHRSQVLLLCFARLHGNQVLMALVDGDAHDDDEHQRDAYPNQYFFPGLHEPSCGTASRRRRRLCLPHRPVPGYRTAKAALLATQTVTFLPGRKFPMQALAVSAAVQRQRGNLPTKHYSLPVGLRGG